MCIHEWERIGEYEFAYYTVDGIKISTALCQCKKCGKKKSRKYMGHAVGNLFEKR